MDACPFSNLNIDRAGEEVDRFLAACGVEQREALRIKLTVEEALLGYREKFGKTATFKLTCIKRFFSLKVELVVEGEPFDPLAANETDEIIRGLLTGIGLAPERSYKNGRNHLVFVPKRKPLSGAVKVAIAVGLALITGGILTRMPEAIRDGANEWFLLPTAETFLGLLVAISGPRVFLSVLSGILAMGDLETLGKIGSRIIKVILLYMSVIAISMTAVGALFFPVEWGGGKATDFSPVLNLVYDIIPSNLFEPFVTGNAPQLIFIAIFIGLAMLILSAKVSILVSLVEQLASIVQTIMAGVFSLLPFFIFVLFTGMIANGKFAVILGAWKPILIILLLITLCYVLNILRLAVTKRLSPSLLFKKAWPTLMIALTTASTAAAFATNLREANRQLGIDPRLAAFGIPIGQILFMPALLALLFVTEATFAAEAGIPITLPWLIIGLITNLLLSCAIPPVPGGAMVGFTIAFTQLGIPMEYMGLALAISAITDFPATAMNVSCWQLTMIDVADSLRMLNRKTLRKKTN